MSAGGDTALAGPEVVATESIPVADAGAEPADSRSESYVAATEDPAKQPIRKASLVPEITNVATEAPIVVETVVPTAGADLPWKLAAGQVAIVHGLRTRPELDGELCDVGEFLEFNERYLVKIKSSEEEMMLNAANLTDPGDRKGEAIGTPVTFGHAFKSRNKESKSNIRAPPPPLNTAQTALLETVATQDSVTFDLDRMEFHCQEANEEWSCKATVPVLGADGGQILKLVCQAKKSMFFDNGNMDCYLVTMDGKKVAEFWRSKEASANIPHADWATEIYVGDAVYADMIGNEFKRKDGSGGLWRYQRLCQLKTQLWAAGFLFCIPTLGAAMYCCYKSAQIDTQIGVTSLDGMEDYKDIVVTPSGTTTCDLTGHDDMSRLDKLILGCFGVGERVTRRPPKL